MPCTITSPTRPSPTCIRTTPSSWRRSPPRRTKRSSWIIFCGCSRIPIRRTALLTQAIDQIRGTVITQVIFAQFELVLHEMAEAGEALTVASFSEAYRRVFTRMLGPDLVFDDMAALGWARIPHFYNNFYVYQYATGYSAAIALSRRVLEKGDAARRDLSRVLESRRFRLSDRNLAPRGSGSLVAEARVGYFGPICISSESIGRASFPAWSCRRLRRITGTTR